MSWWREVAIVWAASGIFGVCLDFGVSLRDPWYLRSIPREYESKASWRSVYGIMCFLGPFTACSAWTHMRRRGLPFTLAWPDKVWLDTERMRQHDRDRIKNRELAELEAKKSS